MLMTISAPKNDTSANSNTETCFVTTVGLEVGDRKKLISQ